MPTYVYQTIPADGNEPVEQFEFKQHFGEPALTAHPGTGKPVRRVISGGLGLVPSSGSATPEAGPGCGPENCKCGRF